MGTNTVTYHIKTILVCFLKLLNEVCFSEVKYVVLSFDMYFHNSTEYIFPAYQNSESDPFDNFVGN